MNDDNLKKQDDEVNENSEMPENIDTQEESMMDSSDVQDDTLTMAAEDPVELTEEVASASGSDSTPSNWIEVVEGKFTCSECENESVPETNTVDGTVQADTEQIKNDLIERPTKIVYGSCPVCGMEYTFKVKNDTLYMEPSDMLK